MIIISNKDYPIGLISHDGALGMFRMDSRYGYYFGICVLESKVNELVHALSCVLSGTNTTVTIAGGSPNLPDNTLTTDIVVRDNGHDVILIERGTSNGNVNSVGIGLDRSNANELMKVLGEGNLNGTSKVKHFVITTSQDGLPYWIIVLNYEKHYEIMTIDNSDHVRGKVFRKTGISRIVNRLKGQWLPYEAAKACGLSPSPDFGLGVSGGHGWLGIPAGGVVELIRLLIDIKDSQQP